MSKRTALKTAHQSSIAILFLNYLAEIWMFSAVQAKKSPKTFRKF
jgi:hypothetical protein